MSSSRDNTFDIMKGFLIILVVIGHAIQTTYRSTDMNVWLNPAFNVIYTFHMPLFIFVSGYFFPSSLKRNFEDVAINKFKRLLLPAIIYSLFLILLYVTITGDIHPRGVFIYSQCKTYWYLICVFLLTMIYWKFYKSGKKVKCFFVFTYLLLLLLYDYLPGYILKDCQLIRQTFIFGFGAFLSMYGKNILKRIKFDVHGWGIILILAIVVLLIREHYGFNMRHYPHITRIIDGFVCSMLAFYFLYPLFSFLSRKSYIGWLSYIGRYSLAIYLIHVVFSRVCLFAEVYIEYSFSNVFLMSVSWLLLSLTCIKFFKWIFKEKSYILGI